MTTSFKVYFNNEIRRVGIPSEHPTFDQVQQAIRTIFSAQISPANGVKIQYIDEDNDYVTVCSQLEWEEALVALSSAPIKKLYISIDNSNRPPATIERKATCNRNPRQSRCGAITTMNKMVDNITNGVKVDYTTLGNSLFRLLNALHSKSLQLLGDKEYGKALNVLKAIIELDPHSAIGHYNMACTHALLGNSETACEYLRKATELGYKNLAHIEADSDLDSIRELAEYAEVISGLKAGCPIRFLATKDEQMKDEQEKKEEEEKKEEPEVKEEEKDEAMPVPEESPVAQPPEIVKVEEKDEGEEFKAELEILSNMGFTDREVIKSLLITEKGNIEIVASILLSIE